MSPAAKLTASQQTTSSKSTDSTVGAPEDIVAFGTGLGANALHGIAESTIIFDIIRDNL
jgi:hypothetical protein